MKNTDIFEPTAFHIAVVCLVLGKNKFKTVKSPYDMEDKWTGPTMAEELENDLAGFAEQGRRSTDNSILANEFRRRISWCQRLLMGYEKLPEKDVLGEYILPEGLGTGTYVFQDLMEVGE